jgi:hypothetical protein
MATVRKLNNANVAVPADLYALILWMPLVLLLLLLLLLLQVRVWPHQNTRRD